MDKLKDMMHGGQKKEGEGVEHTTVPATATTGTGGYGQQQQGMQTTAEGGHEKKGLFGLGGHKKEGEAAGEKKHGFMGMGGGESSSSSSDEEREGAKERNRVRRDRRAQRQAGVTGATGTAMD
jgi:hypothetical protein